MSAMRNSKSRSRSFWYTVSWRSTSSSVEKSSRSSSRRSPTMAECRSASAAPTPSGLSSLSRTRPGASSVAPMYLSSASNPLALHNDGSPCLALSARRELTGNTSGVTPSSARAFSDTNRVTSSTSAGAPRISILFTTRTTFFPQPRICSRNARSVSVNGRSAEVTNSTRSERGTNSAVIASCSRMIALVPGVSTMWMSRRIGAGAVIT